jgi:hypothetical protein
VKESLERHVDAIIKTLPSDLQVVLEKGTILNVDKNYNGASSDSRNSNNISENASEYNPNGNNQPKESTFITGGSENIVSPVDIPKPKDKQAAQHLLNKATTPT